MTPLSSLCRIMKKMDFRIGFANGCFDNLHEGHLHLMKTALKYCDVLFIGINDDDSVHMLKGYGRPINSLGKRMAKLEDTGLCDGIFAFGDENELLDIITDIKPDFLIKGEDYKGKLVTGETYVKQRGGVMLYVPLLPGVSTTRKLLN